MSVDVLHAKVVFRDRPFVDVLDLALRFVVVQGRSYGQVALAVLVPFLAISIAAAEFGGWVLGWVVALALGSVASVPFTVLASRLVFQEQVRIRDVLGAALGDAPKLVFLRILRLLAVVAGTLFFVVPGLYTASIFFFTDEVVLLERSGLGRAFGRSQKIAASSLGEAFVGVLLLGLLSVASILLAESGGRTLIGELLQFRPPRSAFEEGGSVLCFIGWFALIPYVATARFFMYLNVRTREEGWDIQTRFAAIAARSDSADRRGVQ